MSLEALTDHGWHHVCITWSGNSGATLHYLDGTKRASSVGRIWSYSGGDSFMIANANYFPYEISGFNLWNKVLPPEEVKELSRSCVSGIGNVKTWMDFLAPAEKVKAKKGLAIRPSTCEVPRAREIAERKWLNYYCSLSFVIYYTTAVMRAQIELIKMLRTYSPVLYWKPILTYFLRR